MYPNVDSILPQMWTSTCLCGAPLNPQNSGSDSRKTPSNSMCPPCGLHLKVWLSVKRSYKSKYMYCPIIPDPKSPSLTDLNHYFKPLINDMVIAWEEEVQFSHTVLYPMGCLTWSAIIMAVNNLPAARHASGLAAATSHHYCSVCKCWHQSTLSQTDYECWEEHDNDKIQKEAFN